MTDAEDDEQFREALAVRGLAGDASKLEAELAIYARELRRRNAVVARLERENDRLRAQLGELFEACSSVCQTVESSREPREPAVHILLEGRALCGLRPGVPRDWPEGHTWVPMPKTLLELTVAATCGDCLHVLDPRPGNYGARRDRQALQKNPLTTVIACAHSNKR